MQAILAVSASFSMVVSFLEKMVCWALVASWVNPWFSSYQSRKSFFSFVTFMETPLFLALVMVVASKQIGVLFNEVLSSFSIVAVVLSPVSGMPQSQGRFCFQALSRMFRASSRHSWVR